MRFLLQVCRGLIRDQTQRRHAASVVIVAALLMLFFGSTFLAGWLYQHPFVFFGFWFICLWLTFLAFLLGVYDLLVVRREGREAEKRLRKQIFSAEKED